MGMTIESSVVLSVSMRKRFGRINLFKGFRFRIGRAGVTRIAHFWRRELISPSKERRFVASDVGGVAARAPRFHRGRCSCPVKAWACETHAPVVLARPRKLPRADF